MQKIYPPRNVLLLIFAAHVGVPDLAVTWLGLYRLQHFRETYVERLRQEERNQKIKRVCGIVASVAGFVFAPVLKEVAGAVVDFVNPIDIVEKVYGEHDIARFVSEGSEKVLPKVIQEQLEKYAIPQDEFETLLREEIVLQHPEYVEECAKRGLSVNVDGGQSDVARSLEPTLDLEEVKVLKLVGELQAAVGDAVQASRRGRSTQSEPVVPLRLGVPVPTRGIGGDSHSEVVYTPSTPPRSPSHEARFPVSSSLRPPMNRDEHVADPPKLDVRQNVAPPGEETTTRNESPEPRPEVPASADGEPAVLFTEDVGDFHYHMAVHESHGELSHFVELVEMIDSSSCDPNATMSIQLRTATTTEETLCAAEYAYRRGYHEVGDFLVARMDENGQIVDKTPANSMELLEDAEEYPYVFAVDESEGDVDAYEHFLELVDDQDHAVDATIRVRVAREISQWVQWSAVEYACHLGYVEIVKFMLKEVCKESLSMKTKFQMLKAVRERSGVLEGSLRNSTSSA